MDNPDYARVMLPDGRAGYVAGPADNADDRVLVELEGGGELSIPLSALYRDPGGTWMVRKPVSSPSAPDDTTMLPVITEELHVDKRPRVTGTVRVAKDVTHRQESVSMPLARERADVRRVVIDQPVDAVPAIRREGDTIIFPIVEEVPVVRKQLVLKEEVHITRRRTTERHDATVTLREERPVIERLDAEGNRVVVDAEAERKRSRRGELLGPRPRSRVRKNKIIHPD